jgi:hypothetical protein
MTSLVVLLALASPARAEKNRDTAQILSVAGTIASSALVLSSFFIGTNTGEVNEPLLYAGLGTSIFTPSLGQYYAGEYLTLGMGVRGGAAAFALIAFAAEQETTTCDNGTSPNQKCTSLTGPGYALMGLAAIAYVGGCAWDVEDAPDAADRANHVHMAITPTIVPTPNGAVPGVYFSATY